jgi:hypothetical protein
MRDAEFTRDRRGHEAVGRGDDRAQIAAMALNQFACARAHDRQNFFPHEFGVPIVEHAELIAEAFSDGSAEIASAVRESKMAWWMALASLVVSAIAAGAQVYPLLFK